MIHYEQDINQSNGHTILECLDRLDGNLVHPSLVPVRENTRLQTNIVDFKSLLEYTNTSGYSTFTEAVNDIKNYNHIQNLTVSIDEAYIYDMPEIVNLFESYVIKPVSKNSIEYQLCEKYLTPYLETGDESLLEEYCNITESSNEMLKNAVTKAQQNYSQAMAKGDAAGVKKYKAQADRLQSKLNDRTKELSTLQRDMSNNQYEDMDEKRKMQARINNLSGVKTAKPAPSTPNPTNPPASTDKTNVVGDVVSSIAGASGNNQGPSWWARNFAAFKNWMNNNFGTKFNTAIGGYNNYKDYLAKAGSVASNFVGTQTGKNLINQGTDKLKGLADKYGGKYANDLKSGIDMVRDVVGGVSRPANAATEITAGTILSEVYRPRRMYRSTYMRMH